VFTNFKTIVSISQSGTNFADHLINDNPHTHTKGDNMHRVVTNNRTYKSKFATLIPLFFFLTVIQCVPTYSLRLYNLSKSERMEIIISTTDLDQGMVMFTSADGENFEGEYLFHKSQKSKINSSHGYTPDRRSYVTGESSTKRHNESTATLYGYGESLNADPVGSLVLVGDKGTTIDCVFYSVTYNNGTNASGVGKDNDGNIFRIYMSSK
jgi:hypothetical protein